MTVATAIWATDAGTWPGPTGWVTSLREYSPEASTAGSASRNENRTATGRVSPSASPAEIVPPERHAGDQGQALRQAHQEPVAERQLVRPAPLGAVPFGGGQDEREHDQHGGVEVQVPRRSLDRGLEEQPE